MSLGDLDELVISCRTDEAKAYVSEAVACYKAGAYRSCIVASWIAVVYDLLAKIRELALGGDAEAQMLITELAGLQPSVETGETNAIRRILEVERDIVDIANNSFAFFEGQQVLDLKRLQADRNRCAHPTYQGTDTYLPSAELARAHLVHAVRHVLAAVPVQGKAATAHIVRLVESSFFPTDVEQAKVQLRLGGMERPKDSLVRSVIDHLVFNFFEGEAALKGQLRTIIAIRATYDLAPGLCEPRLRKTLNTLGRRIPDTDLLFFFGLQRRLGQTWDFLERDNQTRLTELLKQSTDEVARRIIPTAVLVPALVVDCEARIATLDYESLGVLLRSIKLPAAVARGVDIYCSSKSWGQANTYYTHVIEPILSDLSEAQIRRTLLASTNEGADLNGANSFVEFSRFVYESEKIPKAEVIQILRDNRMGWVADRLEVDPSKDDDEIPF